MTNKGVIQKVKSEIEKGIGLVKCRKCGCMKETLDNLQASLPLIKFEDVSDLLQDVKVWQGKMEPIKYACLGCEHCFPAVATNSLASNFSSLNQITSSNCNFEVKEDDWPPVAGEYFAFCEGLTCPVAVSTLASVDLAESLAKARPKGLCMVGKTETENIGIDKIIKNTIANPTIKYLIIAGQESKGHYSGKTLLALSEKGVNEDMRVIGAPGMRPILKNVSPSEVESFRKQVQVVDLIGCEDAEKIINKIDEFSKVPASTCKCNECSEPISTVPISSVSKIIASEPKKLKMDKAGYFVVIPSLEKNSIVVEHYGYDNKLLHIIEGKDAPSIYSTIVENNWITELSHAAYLGRELSKAELSLKHGIKYIQDKAPGK